MTSSALSSKSEKVAALDVGHCDVSVAIATYQGERFLPEMLDSILAQTLRPREIVCADDASTDGTVDVIESFAKSSAVPIRLIRQTENVGVIENFLTAFRHCDGSIIAYCDQDDCWVPHRLSSAAEHFSNWSTSLLCHGSEIVGPDLADTGHVYFASPGDALFKFPANSVEIFAWGHQMIMSRRTCDALIQLYKVPMFRASSLYSCFDKSIPFAASLCGDIVLRREAMIKFRRHEKSTSTAGNANDEDAAGRGLRRKLARRMHRYQTQRRLLVDEISVLKSASGIVSESSVLKMREGALTLLDARVSMACSGSFVERMMRLPGVLLKAGSLASVKDVSQRVSMAADVLFAIFGAPNSIARN